MIISINCSLHYISLHPVAEQSLAVALQVATSFQACDDLNSTQTYTMRNNPKLKLAQTSQNSCHDWAMIIKMIQNDHGIILLSHSVTLTGLTGLTCENHCELMSVPVCARHVSLILGTSIL